MSQRSRRFPAAEILAQYATELVEVRQMPDLNPTEERLTSLQVRLRVFASAGFSILNEHSKGS